MKQHSEDRQVKIMGIDLGKRSFQVQGVDSEARKVVGKKFGWQKIQA